MELSRVLSFYRKFICKKELLSNIKHELMPTTQYRPYGDDPELIDTEVDELFREGRIQEDIEYEDLLALEDPPICPTPAVNYPFNMT